MKQNFPKFMHRLNGKTTLERIVETIESLGSLFTKPIVVVSKQNQHYVKQTLGRRVKIVTAAARGTGYAVLRAKATSSIQAQDIMPLNGDHPFVRAKTLKRLIDKHRQSKSHLTLLTLKVPSYRGLYNGFRSFGRIVRQGGQVSEIVEWKEAPPKIRKIREVNPTFMVIQTVWAWRQLARLPIHPNGEYYLTDLLKVAAKEKRGLNALVSKDVVSCLSYNTPEDLKRLAVFARRRKI